MMMRPDGIDEFWIDGAGGSDGELRCALDSFCDSGIGIGDSFGDVCCLDQPNSRKRPRDVSCGGPKSKACREKIRRDKLNDRFLELSRVLDPERPPKSDKASILSDAVRVLGQLRKETQQLKELNEKLLETIKEIKSEKNELREEKMRLKADKERLEQQIKAVSLLPPAGLIPTHPIGFHPFPTPPPNCQNPLNKTGPHFAAFPGVAMWQWLPPAVLDTTQDAKLWPPNA